MEPHIPRQALCSAGSSASGFSLSLKSINKYFLKIAKSGNLGPVSLTKMALPKVMWLMSVRGR